MSDLKSKTHINGGGSQNLGINSGFGTKSTSVNWPKAVYDSNSVNGSFDGDLGGMFQSGDYGKAQNHGNIDDVFGEPIKTSKPSNGDGFDLDSFFKGSYTSSLYDDDDIFGGMPGLKISTKANKDDLFPKQSAQIGDLLGDFDGMGLGSNASRKKLGEEEKNSQEFDDLIPGFGGSNPSRSGENSDMRWSPLSSGHSAKSTATSAEDPFGVLQKPVKKDAGETSVLPSVDELEDFAMGKVQNYANKQPNYSHKERVETAAHDLDSFFSLSAHPSSGSRHKSTTVHPVLDSLFQRKGGPGVEQTHSQTSSSTKKASLTSNVVDDFSFLFGEAFTSSGEFQEIEGESEERRRARLNYHMRTQQRMAKALEEKNRRDLQTKWEQEERHRIAETLGDGKKHWAAGKEGNLHALLSSLQYVPMIVALAILCHIDLVASHTPNGFMNPLKESWSASTIRCCRGYSSLPAISRISAVVFWVVLVIVLVILVLAVCFTCVRIRAAGPRLAPAVAPQGLDAREIELFPLIGAPQGLDPHEIELLPLIEFPIDIELGHETDECYICMEEFMKGDIIRMLSACRHVYHAHCIDPWISKSSHCPVCRYSIK